MRTVSNNVANINTDGYVRRVVNQEAQVSGTQLTGVDIADIQRVADQFLESGSAGRAGGPPPNTAPRTIPLPN